MNRHFGLWLFTALWMWSLSLQAGSQVGSTLLSDSFQASQLIANPVIKNPVIESPEHSHAKSPECSARDSLLFSDLAGIKKTSSKHYSFVELQSKVSSFFKDKLEQISAGRGDHLIREICVTGSDFYLVTEFNPPDPAIKTIADTRFPTREIPWYLAPSQQYKFKLAGWQDSNSLYRARLTFFI